MATLAGNIAFHPAAAFTAVGIDFVSITVSGADVDLTSPTSPTAGLSARGVRIGSTGGNLVCATPGSTTAGVYTLRTIPVSAGETIPLAVCYIAGIGSGTTCTPVGVLL